jgi:hypothetical protein
VTPPPFAFDWCGSKDTNRNVGDGAAQFCYKL